MSVEEKLEQLINSKAKSPSLLKEMSERLDVNFRRCFVTYLNRASTALSQVKTLAHGDSPIPLDEMYVESNFSSNKKEYSEKVILESIKGNARLIISGMAGAGKSIFVKRAFTNSCKDLFGRIPIYLELRRLNASETQDLTDELHKSIQDQNHNFSRSQFEYALDSGIFLIFLDGLDELERSIEKSIIRQILNLSERHPQISIVVSSRPDDFTSWNRFTEYRIQPLTQPLLIELINKISSYDSGKRELFISKINDGLFESHKQFLSNPLIATMTFITFCCGNSIPSEIHAFYESAFNALASLHDGTKENFEREFYSGLSTVALKSSLSLFSVYTFQDQKYTMSRTLTLEYIEDALKQSGYQAISESVLKDWQRAIGVIIRDGIDFTYIHRSFQEYFVAYCMYYIYPDNARPMMESLLHDYGRSQHVIKVLRSMNERLTGQIVCEILDDALNLYDESKPLEFFKSFASGFRIQETPYAAEKASAGAGKLEKIDFGLYLRQDIPLFMLAAVRAALTRFDSASHWMLDTHSSAPSRSIGFREGPYTSESREVPEVTKEEFARRVYSDIKTLRASFAGQAVKAPTSARRQILARPKR
jgi:hypothetical protein